MVEETEVKKTSSTTNAEKKVEDENPMAPAIPRLCRYCSEEIRPTAKVCNRCGRHQSLFWQHFRIEQVGLLISVVMIMITLFQLGEARSERIAASEAVARAKQAETNVITLNNALREQFLFITSLTWLQIETKNEFGTERHQLAIQEMLKEINAILPQVLPDPVERQQWINALQKRLPRK